MHVEGNAKGVEYLALKFGYNLYGIVIDLIYTLPSAEYNKVFDSIHYFFLELRLTGGAGLLWAWEAFVPRLDLLVAGFAGSVVPF